MAVVYLGSGLFWVLLLNEREMQSSAPSTWTGSLRKGFLREESQYLRLSLTRKRGTGSTAHI